MSVGASDPTSGDQSTHPELGRIQVSFVEFAKRNGVSTARYLDSIRHVMTGIPGAEIAVNQDKTRAANILGIDLSTLYRKLKRYDAV